MRPTIGIVGGAGPMAGALLFRRIITVLQERCDCRADADFPRILLINEPFAEMLDPPPSSKVRDIITNQLAGVLEMLEKSGAQTVAIACNTLHSFLPNRIGVNLVNMVELTGQAIEQLDPNKVLVLCSRTARDAGLYSPFENAFFPNNEGQSVIDGVIDEVLAGQCSTNQIAAVQSVIADSGDISAVALGCSELSLLWDSSGGNLVVIDPIQLVVDQVV